MFSRFIYGFLDLKKFSSDLFFYVYELSEGHKFFQNIITMECYGYYVHIYEKRILKWGAEYFFLPVN